MDVDIRLAGDYLLKGGCNFYILKKFIGFCLCLQKSLMTIYCSIKFIPDIRFHIAWSKPITLLIPPYTAKGTIPRSSFCQQSATQMTHGRKSYLQKIS